MEQNKQPGPFEVAPPTGDPEVDLTQLVCLIEAIAPDDADQASTPGLSQVVWFARDLRARWEADE